MLEALPTCRALALVRDEVMASLIHELAHRAVASEGACTHCALHNITVPGRACLIMSARARAAGHERSLTWNSVATAAFGKRVELWFALFAGARCSHARFPAIRAGSWVL